MSHEDKGEREVPSVTFRTARLQASLACGRPFRSQQRFSPSLTRLALPTGKSTLPRPGCAPCTSRQDLPPTCEIPRSRRPTACRSRDIGSPGAPPCHAREWPSGDRLPICRELQTRLVLLGGRADVAVERASLPHRRWAWARLLQGTVRPHRAPDLFPPWRVGQLPRQPLSAYRGTFRHAGGNQPA